MKELFVPFDIALRAKELGFNEPCFTYYCTDGYFSETPKIVVMTSSILVIKFG